MKIVRTMQPNNRLDKLPEDLQTKIWAYYLAHCLKKVVFLKHGLSDKALNVLHNREPSVGAMLVSNNLLFVSEVCGVDTFAFRNPMERWWGPRCGHKLHTTLAASTYLPPWYQPLSTFFAAIYGRGWVDVLSIDATHSQIESAAKRARKVSLLSYKWALRDLKRGKASNIDFKKQNPAFFGSLQDAKREVLELLQEIQRQEQRKVDSKADAFVRGKN